MVATYTQLLAERYRGKLDGDADKYIHYTVDGALRMQILIQDLLTFSRTGREGNRSQNTDCNIVLDTAMRNLETVITETGAQISRDCLPEVNADRSQLLQVFQNLIGNSIKFRGSARPVIRVAATKIAREWSFTVTDNGIGIDPECSESIFVIFKRLHTREEYPGSGIGLSICKRIIERHGGRIWVEPQPGQGSAFKFTLPVAANEEQHAHINETCA